MCAGSGTAASTGSETSRMSGPRTPRLESIIRQPSYSVAAASEMQATRSMWRTAASARMKYAGTLVSVVSAEVSGTASKPITAVVHRPYMASAWIRDVRGTSSATSGGMEWEPHVTTAVG